VPKQSPPSKPPRQQPPKNKDIAPVYAPKTYAIAQTKTRQDFNEEDLLNMAEIGYEPSLSQKSFNEQHSEAKEAPKPYQPAAYSKNSYQQQ